MNQKVTNCSVLLLSGCQDDHCSRIGITLLLWICDIWSKFSGLLLIHGYVTEMDFVVGGQGLVLD